LNVRQVKWSLKVQRWLSHFSNPSSINIAPRDYWNDRKESDKWAVEFACNLSRRLSVLDCTYYLHWSVVPLLPRCLSSLFIENAVSRDHTELADLPNTLTALGLSFLRISPVVLQSLPRSLFQLRIGHTKQSTIRGSYAHLPPNLTSLISRSSGKLGNFEGEHLPSSLTELKLRGNAKITDAAVESLPMSIIILDLDGHKLTGRTLNRLNLLSFAIESYSWTEDGISLLPKTLTHLSIRYPSIRPACFKAMPPKLRLLECAGENKSLLESLHRLPPTLQYVTVNAKRYKVKLKKPSK
jgi:hypothetical protein